MGVYIEQVRVRHVEVDVDLHIYAILNYFAYLHLLLALYHDCVIINSKCACADESRLLL